MKNVFVVQDQYDGEVLGVCSEITQLKEIFDLDITNFNQEVTENICFTRYDNKFLVTKIPIDIHRMQLCQS